MNKALASKAGQHGNARKTGTFCKRMSNHVAFALLVYTGLHIFVTMTALKTSSGSIAPYFALVVLVAAIIPACRWFEKRWENEGVELESDPAPVFRRDVLLIWLGAVGLPVALTLGYKGITSLV